HPLTATKIVILRRDVGRRSSRNELDLIGHSGIYTRILSKEPIKRVVVRCIAGDPSANIRPQDDNFHSEWLRCTYYAVAAICTSACSSPNRTDTTFDTPGSCMVTP